MIGLKYVAFLQLQLLPQVLLTAGDTVGFAIETRAIGTITGSRSAVAMGRIPIEDVAGSLAASWIPFGAKTDDSVVFFATWVDTYDSFGRTLHCAIHVAGSL